MSLDSSEFNNFAENKEIDSNNSIQVLPSEGPTQRRFSVREIVQNFNSQINQKIETNKKDQEFYLEQKQRLKSSVSITQNPSIQDSKQDVQSNAVQDLNKKENCPFEEVKRESIMNNTEDNQQLSSSKIEFYKKQYIEDTYKDFPAEKINLLESQNKQIEHQNELIKDQLIQLQAQINEQSQKLQQTTAQNSKLTADYENSVSEIKQIVLEKDQAIGEKNVILQQINQFMDIQQPSEQVNPEQIAQNYQSLNSKYSILEKKFVQSKLENNNLKRQIEDMQDKYDQQQQIIFSQKQTISGLRETLEMNLKIINQHQKKPQKPQIPQNLNQSFQGDPFNYGRNNTEEQEQDRQNPIQQLRKVSQGGGEPPRQELKNKVQNQVIRTNVLQQNVTKQRISRFFGSLDSK